MMYFLYEGDGDLIKIFLYLLGQAEFGKYSDIVERVSYHLLALHKLYRGL